MHVSLFDACSLQKLYGCHADADVYLLFSIPPPHRQLGSLNVVPAKTVFEKATKGPKTQMDLHSQ